MVPESSVVEDWTVSTETPRADRRPYTSPRIVLWVGDNITDFPDLDQTVRTRPEEAFADFGRRFIVIPNPMYGSWESNPRE